MSEPEVSNTTNRERRTRGLTQLGACATALGIALAAAGDEDLSRWLTLGGVAAMVVALHRFGRLGADPPSAPRAPGAR